MLNDSQWTKWQLVLSPCKPSEGQSWEKRNGCSTGFRRKIICGGLYKKTALYEFAVQAKEHCKRYVVYCKSSKGFMLSKGSWESKLLRSPGIKEQIEEVLKNDGRIFARKCILKKSPLFDDKIACLSHYDYAWSNCGKGKLVPREVAAINAKFSM